MKKKLKIGILGAGYLGKLHIENWLKISEVEIVGFCDIDDEIAYKVIEKYNIKRFLNFSELCDQSEAIDIVIPTIFHFEYAKKAIKSGKHIFIEKPLTQSVEEAQSIVSLVREAGIICQIGHIERFNPAFKEVAKLKPEPRFIESHRLSTYNLRGTDVNVIFDLMIHDLDIILNLVKSNVSHISANGVSVISPNLDIVSARLEFRNGCVANLTSSRLSLKKMRKMRLFEKDKYISLDFLEKKVELIKIKPEAEFMGFGIPILTSDGEKYVNVKQIEIPNENPLLEELKYFINCIFANQIPEISEIEGLNVLVLAEQIAEKIMLNLKKT